jgi:tRNA A-37 threonylcarbamoyl transferase component Bud32/2-polyprenyl-3-methyl-5-hydroxy-6-metoxy-1,4-benzoquinol methylase
MLFDPEAIANKQIHLDAVLHVKGLVDRVVARYLPGPVRIEKVPRVWEPGGGATLFRIESSQGAYLLKVKHSEVWVESRLESEPAFIRRSSLGNEHAFLRELHTDWLPRVGFFESVENFEFLALEWLTPFAAVVKDRTIPQLLDAWAQLEHAVRELFSRNIVHTDLHEHNLCFRESQLVLVDFEEARVLKQDVAFEASLDVVGRNKYGDVGEIPTNQGRIPGLTCLARLREVFKDYIRQRLPDLLSNSSFGQDCPYNLDQLQEPDGRIYQSLTFGDFRIAGQRPVADSRLRLLAFLFRRLALKVGAIRHLDVGCNMGAFCFRAAQLCCVQETVGVDAADNYVHIATALAVLYYDGKKMRFRRMLCGQDMLSDVFAGTNVLTMFSVYHHIVDKDGFLADIKRLAPAYLIAEFATQDRFYLDRGSLASEIAHIQNQTGFRTAQVLAVSSDYQRPIILFANEPFGWFTSAVCRVLVKNPWVELRFWLGYFPRKARGAFRKLREAADQRG